MGKTKCVRISSWVLGNLVALLGGMLIEVKPFPGEVHVFVCEMLALKSAFSESCPLKFCLCDVQLSSRQCVVLRHHHAPQPAAASGRGKDGRAPGWRTAEDGGPVV